MAVFCLPVILPDETFFQRRIGSQAAGTDTRNIKTPPKLKSKYEQCKSRDIDLSRLLHLFAYKRRKALAEISEV